MSRAARHLHTSVQRLDAILKAPQAREFHLARLEAPSVIRDLDHQLAPTAVKSNMNPGGCGVFEDVGKPFGDEEVSRTLELEREACPRPKAVGFDLNRDRHSCRPLGDSLDQATVGEDCGVDSTRQLLQPLERALS